MKERLKQYTALADRLTKKLDISDNEMSTGLIISLLAVMATKEQWDQVISFMESL